MQETELQEYCGRRGWERILYRDKGQSGAKQDRPALNLLLNDLRKRKVDVILVWSLDRLARSLKQLLTISEECRSWGVDLVSLRQNIDTTLPAGRLTFQILGAVAEFERELLRDRVIGRPGLRHAPKRSPSESDIRDSWPCESFACHGYLRPRRCRGLPTTTGGYSRGVVTKCYQIRFANFLKC